MTVSYKLQSGQIQVFRKTFQFCVKVPLDIKTQFYYTGVFIIELYCLIRSNVGDLFSFFQQDTEVYMEAILQNLSLIPMCLENVSLEPSEYFTVNDMNYVPDTSQSTNKLVFGQINRFNPNDCRQYLFCLNPKTILNKDINLMRTVRSYGKFNIAWTSGIGSKGRLQTPQLERTVSYV